MRAIADLPEDGIAIGPLSALTGVDIETIRDYEKIRMLPAPRRTASGRRIYGPEEMRALAFLRRGARDILDVRRPGASIKTILPMINLRQNKAAGTGRGYLERNFSRVNALLSCGGGFRNCPVG